MVARQLVGRVVEEVEGYPYFIQLWGAELWDAGVTAEVDQLDVRLLEATTPDIYRRLDIDFYEPRVSTTHSRRAGRVVGHGSVQP